MTDLLTMVEQVVELRKVSTTNGGEYAGPCPLCNEGDDRFRVWPYRDDPGWWCRRCDHKGDAIDFAREVLGLSFPEACVKVGKPEKLTNYHGRNICSVVPAKEAKKAKKADEVISPPPDQWQERGIEFLKRCQESLWSSRGRPALEYLDRRGIREETAKAFRLGFNPNGGKYEPGELWGLDKPVWVPDGIIIPCLPTATCGH